MFPNLSRNFLFQQLEDRRYYRFQAGFAALNLARIEKFSLITAIAVSVVVLLPNLFFGLFWPENKIEGFTSLLFLEVSAVCFMLLCYLAVRRVKEEKQLRPKLLLINAFIVVCLLHALLISLALNVSPLAVPVFLLTCCALMTSLYWPIRRVLLLIGLGQVLYFGLHYQLYQEPALFHTFLIGQLTFLLIFYTIGRTILNLKLRDFENEAKIEAQQAQLIANNQRLRMTEHALSSLNLSSHQGVFRLEGTKGITYVNDILASMMGFASAADLIQTGRSYTFIPQAELDAIALKVNQQGFVDGLEVEATRKNGSRLWLQISCSVRSDPQTGQLIYEGRATDISRKKKALQEALENAAKLEQAEKIANTGFYEIDISTTHFAYSAGYCAILEIENQESLCLNDHLDYLHPQDRQEARQILLQAIMRGEGYTLDYRVATPAGEWKYLTSKGRIIKNEKGKDFKILATVQDVTQLRQQQQALEQSQAIIRAAFDHNHHFGLYIFDTEYKILTYNQEGIRRTRRQHGVDLTKAKDMRSLLNPVAAETFIPAFKKALMGESVRFEYKHADSHHPETWNEIFVGPVRNAQEEVIGAIMMAADITARKQNEELLANLSLVASRTDNAVMISDRKYRVEWINEAFVRATGYSLEEIRGQYPREFMVSEATDGATLERLNNCLRRARPFSDEILLRNRKNEQKWVQLTINPVMNAGGTVERFVSVYTDLSERKAFEQELRKAKEVAEHSAEIKDYFLSTVSHELRTPLNAVIGLAYHLLQNNPRPDQFDDLNILKFSAENLLSLINDILDLSKIEAGKIKIERVQFNLRDILNSLKHTFRTQTKAKGLQFSLQLQENVPHELEGDPVRLIQIMTNLLSNAIKFTHVGQVTVIISATPLEGEQYLLTAEVKDTGIGIPENRLEAIFEKFEQANTSTAAYGGTGLGLAITKQLVELQQGRIWVNSRPGMGSTFGFSIPYRKTSKTDLKPLAYTFGTEPGKDLSKLHVLMAEDNLINQAVAGKFLLSWGIRYDVAENGKIALEMASEKAYDLLLMDLQMPEMDGFDATRQIRQLSSQDYSKTPIIAITAAGIVGIEDKLKEAGFTDMVLKPFKPESLLYKLNYYCPFTKQTKTAMHTPQATDNSETLLDLSGVYEVAGGDRAFLEELIGLYIRQFTEIPLEIRQATAARDRQQLRRIFHKLRPSVLMLKLDDMATLGENIHQLLHDEQTSMDTLHPLMENYMGMMDLLKNKLQQAEAEQPAEKHS
ncbi:PAS domain S-box protein [Cesiribacter andamanensis]|uniref:histidine kinase n=1 Tax=Cesiribacter andamanensis AMV16 TaxID=1279009 RepID=M7N4X0_9BACT|nr:PAS domain S-box protein [Cesiribacter andamanensis]EMR02342.1 Autoinducer 2 sensor kinase/phosphatase luxQ [Cesiribacter andamanensis AMV16]